MRWTYKKDSLTLRYLHVGREVPRDLKFMMQPAVGVVMYEPESAVNVKNQSPVCNWIQQAAVSVMAAEEELKIVAAHPSFC